VTGRALLIEERHSLDQDFCSATGLNMSRFFWIAVLFAALMRKGAIALGRRGGGHKSVVAKPNISNPPSCDPFTGSYLSAD
jgi:hypothetical protein